MTIDLRELITYLHRNAMPVTLQDIFQQKVTKFLCITLHTASSITLHTASSTTLHSALQITLLLRRDT